MKAKNEAVIAKLVKLKSISYQKIITLLLLNIKPLTILRRRLLLKAFRM